ncbi:MAG: hypothetical protein FJ117_21150 [Deltaproteobacteria bacterium]|nr:hypothetical protein [Deltaproteobacteria bacterium]
MINQEKSLTIQDYLAIAARRKWYIILPLVLSVFVSIAVYYYLPKVYKAKTLILVQPQKVPDRYVPSTVTASVVDRLHSITLEILSRSRLEQVVKEFNLFADIQGKVSMDEIIDQMRKLIDIRPEGQAGRRPEELSAFSISYQGEEPKTVMMVTNKLASSFIEENLKVRESLSEGTSDFINRELHAMEENLQKKEQAIRNYKERFSGNLPSQLDMNLRILDRSRERLDSVNEKIMDMERRGVILKIQIDQVQKPKPLSKQVESTGDELLDREIRELEEGMKPEKMPDDPLITQYNNLQKDLNVALLKYTERHPDVRELKSKISQLEPKIRERILELEKGRQENMEKEKMRKERLQELKARRDKILAAKKGGPVGMDAETEKHLAQLMVQYDDLQWEINKLRKEEKDLKSQVLIYQRKVEEVPKREEELASLMRDYGLLKGNHQALLARKMEAKMAENLERKQQGEQFKILDPARLPTQPFKPNRDRILLFGMVIGLVLGMGLAWFRENLDHAFYTEADLEAYLSLPILAVVPNLKEETLKET